MESKSNKHIHTLPDGTRLTAYSVDPDLQQSGIQKIVEANLQKPLGQAALAELAQQYPIIHNVEDLNHLKTEIVDNSYQIPVVLRPFADAVVAERLAINPSMFPGPIMSCTFTEGGMVLSRANYFDFLGTNGSFEQVPANYADNPHHLPEGKTLAEIVNEENVVSEGNSLTRADMVNYLGQAFVVVADGQLGFVQRASGMGVVANVPALAGGTPPFDDYQTRTAAMLKDVKLSDAVRKQIYANAKAKFGPESANPVGFFAPGFNFADYITAETAKEMMEEFCLQPNEFIIDNYILLENRTNGNDSTSAIGTVVKTHLGWDKIADRCYGNPGVIKEHPLIYAVEATPLAFSAVIDNMAMYDGTARIGYEAVRQLRLNFYDDLPI